MAATVPRSHWIDDDGSGTTGTVINDAEKQKLYNDMDAGLGAVTLTNIAPGGTATLSAANPTITLIDTSAPTDQKVFRLYNSLQKFVLDTTNDAISAQQTFPLQITRTGDLFVWRDLYEKQRSTPVGHWIDVPWNAANFTASAGTWTIGTAATNRYTLIGKTLIYQVALQSCNVSATPTTLHITLPAGIQSAVFSVGLLHYFNGGTSAVGMCYMSANDTQVHFVKNIAAPPWAADAACTFYASISVSVV